jgi:AcrR family transcriptional regulator
MMTEPASDRKHAILDAACRVIAQAGAARLRVADVAREAGVSTALVHYYFPARADVIEQAFAHADDLADAVAEAELRTIATGRRRVEKLFATWAGDAPAIRANWAIWNEMWQYGAHHEGARRLVESSHRRWLEQIHDLIVEGVDDGSIPTGIEPWPAARRLAACINEWGREALLGLRSAGDLRRDLVATTQRELGPAKAAKGKAA